MRASARSLSRLPLSALVALAVAGCTASADAAVESATSSVQEVERRAINPGSSLSEAHQVGDTYYFSGKLGISQETRAMTEGRVDAETRNILDAFTETFAELDLELSDAVQARVFLTDVADFRAFNAVYQEYFPENPPARETVVVADLVAGAVIEISFIAVRR